jgi:uncharacterized protein (TIGR03437 family)
MILMRLLSFLFLTALLIAQTTPQVGGGNIATFAGTGTAGFSGDNGAAAQAQVNFPFGPNDEEFGHLALDVQGNLYIADKGNHRIRRVAPDGTIRTVAGTGTRGFSGDSGPAVQAQLSFPCGIAVDRTGNVFITDQANQRVRKIDTAGVITTVAGNGTRGFSGDGGPARDAALNEPSAVAVDAAGNLYISDYLNDRIRRVDNQTGIIRTIAGNGEHGDNDIGRDNVAATSIRLGYPAGLALDAAGNLFIADHHNDVVRVLSLQNGQIRRIAGTGQHADAEGGPSGVPATSVRLGWPVGLAFDPAGNLYVADFHNNVIRRISSPLSAQPISTTIAGTGTKGYLGDQGPAAQAALDFPAGIAIDSNLNLFIADWHNQRVRRALPGTPAPGPERPSIHSGGLVNGASFAPAPARVAPGSVVSIFGLRLASGTSAADRIPLPTSLLNTTVLVTSGGVTAPMPLFFVSPTQINAQLPAEVVHGAEAQVVVRNGSAASDPLHINVSLSETGIFTYEGNRAVALNQDGSLNSPARPAARNTYLTVFLTGQGALNPAIPSGQAAPANPLSRAAYEASATIGGRGALVEFLGATPGFVALSQANILVPHDAPLGDQHLIITVAGHPSNNPMVHIAP